MGSLEGCANTDQFRLSSKPFKEGQVVFLAASSGNGKIVILFGRGLWRFLLWGFNLGRFLLWHSFGLAAAWGARPTWAVPQAFHQRRAPQLLVLVAWALGSTLGVGGATGGVTGLHRAARSCNCRHSRASWSSLAEACQPQGHCGQPACSQRAGARAIAQVPRPAARATAAKAVGSHGKQPLRGATGTGRGAPRAQAGQGAAHRQDG